MLELRRGDAAAALTMTRLTTGTALLLTLPPLLWAGNAVVGRALVGSVPPLELNAMRWGLAFLLLLPLGWRALARPGEIRARLGHLALLGLVGVGSFNALQYAAVHTSTPLNVTLIVGSMPLFMMLVGALFMLWTDTAARTLFDPRELPVGIITAIIGAPIFLVILLRYRRVT